MAGTCDLLGLSPWPAKASAHDARLGCEVPITFDLGPDGAEAGMRALPDHAALELGIVARDVEE